MVTHPRQPGASKPPSDATLKTARKWLLPPFKKAVQPPANTTRWKPSPHTPCWKCTRSPDAPTRFAYTIYGHQHSTLPFERHFLHAARLEIRLRGEQEARIFEAPLPAELAAFLTALRRAS